jgi:hypothetical protein
MMGRLVGAIPNLPAAGVVAPSLRVVLVVIRNPEPVVIGRCLPGLSYQQLAELGSATTPSVWWNTLAQLPSRKVTFSTPKCWSSR